VTSRLGFSGKKKVQSLKKKDKNLSVNLSARWDFFRA